MMLRFLVMLSSLVFFACGSNSEGSKVSGEIHSKTIKTFMPENNLWQEDGFMDNGMTEEKFNEIIDYVGKAYKPIVELLGGNLVIKGDWNDSTVNAYADREDGNWNVSMFGGLARRAEVTEDGFAMVIAHEISHHIGGYPFVQEWAANEGNSDTGAFLAVAKYVWQSDDIKVTEVDPEAKKLCTKYYKEDMDSCYRQMNAAYSLANLLGQLGGKQVKFETPSKAVVSRTKNSHPEAQCRLDTMVSAILCDVPWNYNVIPQTKAEMAKQSCVYADVDGKYNIRNKPRCWYKP